jgi:hypothetical protein
MAIEYPLPGGSIPEKAKSQIQPWLLQFVGFEGSAAHHVLEANWHDVRDPCLALLRDFLVQFVPTSIITHGDSAWLVIADPERSDAEYLRCGDRWFVAPPPRREMLQRQLEAFGLQGIESLQSFFSHFNGLREDIPGCSGDISRPEEWHHLASLGWEGYIEECQNHESWQKAIMLWHARNGDIVLLNPSGETGWWDHEQNEIGSLTDTFPGFVRHFAAYIEHRYPFSAWPPDY